jgi:tetratricopeptide (TPR) repeat protein
MKPEEKYSREIADYLYNDMSEQDRTVFEEKLKADKGLASEVKRQKDILNGIATRIKYEEAMADEFIDEANMIAKEVVSNRHARASKTQSTEVIKKTINIRYLLAAAAVVLILLVSGLMFINPTPEKLYHNFYKPFSAANFTERTSYSETSLESNGIEEYTKGNYSEAIEILSRIKEEEELSAESNFILGLSYMANEDFMYAKEVFSDHPNHYFHLQTEVNWYLGLCYLQLGDITKALNYFNNLSGTSGKFRKKAKQLSRKLEKALD